MARYTKLEEPTGRRTEPAAKDFCSSSGSSTGLCATPGRWPPTRSGARQRRHFRQTEECGFLPKAATRPKWQKRQLTNPMGLVNMASSCK